MDPSEVPVPTPEGLLTFTGLSLVTTAIVEVILRAWQPSAEQKDRFGPILAFLVAIALAVLGAIYIEADLMQAVLTGVVVGWTAMGVHSTAKAVTR